MLIFAMFQFETKLVTPLASKS